MEQFYPNFKILARYLIAPLSLFFLLKSLIDSLFGKYIVEPILSTCYPSRFTFDIAAFFLLLAFSLPYFIKVFKARRIPFRAFLFSITVLVIYLSYRIPNTPFVLTETKSINRIKLADLFFIIPSFVCFGYLWFRFKKQHKVEKAAVDILGFAVDEPIEIAKENDLLNRNKFIEVIADKIRNTETKNGSFPIGIVAKWGAGKTTFINTLLTKFKGEEVIKIELNVWKCSSNTQLVETLFKELKEKLEKYSFTINNQLQSYAVSLLKGAKGEGLNSIKNITELIMPDASLAKQYESINEEVKQIGKKIVIVIDDLDRLDKKEIYEVIRLIRNTANFSNTFFIVAYDRNYILNAIEEINPYQTHYFLEKIFQIEFSLPVISDTILQKEIWIRIEPFLTDAARSGYKMLQERGFAFFEYGDADLTTSFIHNIRDVVRFVNSFKLSYEFVKDEVYFPDFYNLELIKFKHPDLFTMIYKEHHKLFTTDREGAGTFYGSSNTYSLQKVYEGGKKTRVSELRVLIENNKHNLKLSDRDIDIVCIAFGSIFPEPGNILSSRKETLNYHLSVLLPSMFDRYFILGIEGKLSEITFSKMRQFPYLDFIKQIDDLVLNQGLANELGERFELVKSFDNKEDFEKIVKGIFHFANLPNTDVNSNRHFKFTGYQDEVLAKLLGAESSIAFFKSKEEYKDFIFNLLKNHSNRYGYSDEFLRSLLHRSYYYIQNLFTEIEISDLAFENFKNFIVKQDKLTFDLWWLFMNCQVRQKSNDMYGSYELRYPVQENAISIMRKFIWEVDLNTFLHFIIRNGIGQPFQFVIDNHLRFLFKSNELFVWMLKRDSRELTYKEEFLRFYDALTSIEEYKNNGVPLKFFETIPVNKGIDEV